MINLKDLEMASKRFGKPKEDIIVDLAKFTNANAQINHNYVKEKKVKPPKLTDDDVLEMIGKKSGEIVDHGYLNWLKVMSYELEYFCVISTCRVLLNTNGDDIPTRKPLAQGRSGF